MECSCQGHHSHDDAGDMGVLYSLYSKIDRENVECLNESVEGAGRYVFKDWNERNDGKLVESDADEELLFNVPFSGYVKIKGIIVLGGEDGSHPSLMRLYKNREHMTFDEVTGEADQEFELCPDSQAVVEYQTKIAKFSNVFHLTLHFPKNFGSETTKIYYIGLRGEFQMPKKEGVMITNYELWANPSDHDVKDQNEVPHQIF